MPAGSTRGMFRSKASVEWCQATQLKAAMRPQVHVITHVILN